MSKNILVILESPNKIKSVSEILKKVNTVDSFTVKASMGHITNIKKDGKFHLGIDLNTFEESYEVIEEKKEIVKELKKLVKNSDEVYLATDGDIEGEYIAWNLINELKIPKNKAKRVIFTEITEIGIKNGLKNISSLDINKVSSARCRRLTDRIVGFQTSEVVRVIPNAKSAGRVQSAALNLIVSREDEIRNFKPIEYFEIYLTFKKDKKEYEAQYKGTKDKKIVSIKNPKEVETILKECKENNFKVSAIEEKERIIESKEPFTTATFQMECLAKFSMTSKKAMDIAQSLFEGKSIFNSSHGLITYHRTDSTRISEEFVCSCKKFIEEKYTKNLYKGPKEYKKKDNEQSGHECLRITDPELTPEKIAQFLSSEELKVYTLIYNRTLASLMSAAKVKDTNIIIENGKHRFILSGHKLIEEGFRKVYIEFSEEKEKEIIFPSFSIGEKIEDKGLRCERKQTSPPSRYSEASFVKKMSESGIGRPSTYAPTIETLKKRKYISLEKKLIVPTLLGADVNAIMTKHFPEITDIQYTANMEKIMDDVANSKKNYKDELLNFWPDFHKKVILAKKSIKNEKEPLKLLDEVCPICGAKLVERKNKNNQSFLACSRFPKCKFTKSIDSKNEDKKIICPSCKKGFLVRKVNKKGQIFYGCSDWSKTKCNFTMSEVEYKKLTEQNFTEISSDN